MRQVLWEGLQQKERKGEVAFTGQERQQMGQWGIRAFSSKHLNQLESHAILGH
jgi:hypothetical protein